MHQTGEYITFSIQLRFYTTIALVVVFFLLSFSLLDLNKRAHFFSNSLQLVFLSMQICWRASQQKKDFLRLFGSQFPVFLFRVQTFKFVVDAKQICNAFPTFINILPFHSWLSRLLFGNAMCAGWNWFLYFLLLYSCLEFQCSWSICSSFPYTIWWFFCSTAAVAEYTFQH